MEQLEQKVARISALIYSSISIGLALLFLWITLINREAYTAVARVGGMIWVFILVMIITMPIVIPKVKDKYMNDSAAESLENNSRLLW